MKNQIYFQNKFFLKLQQAIHKNLKGHTVLIIAHRLSTIETADKILVIDHGEILEMGNHKELLKKNAWFVPYETYLKMLHVLYTNYSVYEKCIIII